MREIGRHDLSSSRAFTKSLKILWEIIHTSVVIIVKVVLTAVLNVVYASEARAVTLRCYYNPAFPRMHSSVQLRRVRS